MLAAISAAALATFVSPASAGTTLQVGSTPTGVPFTFLDTKTDTIQGMMVDLIEAIAKDNGLGVKIVPMAFSALVPSLTSGKIDVISAAMSATPKRMQVIDFTAPVYSYGEGLIVPAADHKQYDSIQDMRGYRVGVEIGTNYYDQMKKSGVFSAVVGYNSIADIIGDVEAGRIQAGFGDYPILAYQFSHAAIPRVRLVKEYHPYVIGPINIAVRKDEPGLLAKFNASIAKFKQDGTLKAILAKWDL